MDNLSVGKFIAENRAQKGMTQEQLGERLGVTNKTISRWETGAYMPPADALLNMSEIFEVSINEILSGRRLAETEYRQAAEENLKSAIKSSCFSLKERMKFFKKKWLKDHVTAIIIYCLIVAGLFIAGIMLKNYWVSFAGAVLGLILYGFNTNAMMSYAEKKVFDDNKSMLDGKEQRF